MRSHTLLIVTLITVLAFPLLGGCASRKSQEAQFGRTGDSWMCRPDAQREDWDCVQDSALARSVEQGTIRHE